MKIGVSGSSGYLAGQLIPLLKEKGHEIVPIPQDIVIPKLELDIMFHLGAMTNLYFCEKNVDESLRGNVETTYDMARYCIENNVKLIFASSSTADESLRDIWSAYDRHKWIAEQIVKEVPQHIILRLSTVYGYSNAESGAGRGIINLWIQNGLAGKDITVYDYVVDKYRDYVHVDDVARAFVAAIDAPNGTYDVCTKNCWRIYDAANQIRDTVQGKIYVAKTPAGLHPIDMRDDKPKDTYKWLPKWIPQIQIEEGVRMTARKYKDKMK